MKLSGNVEVPEFGPMPSERPEFIREERAVFVGRRIWVVNIYREIEPHANSPFMAEQIYKLMTQ